MKKLVLLAVLALALPVAVLASSNIDYSSSGGTLKGSNSGLTLSGSVLIGVNGNTGLITGDLGSVSFETGALLSGSLKNGGTFAGGGWFTITGNGSNGVPSGVLFTGTFSGPAHWEMDPDSTKGNRAYILWGWVSGTTASGYSTSAFIHLDVSTGKGYFSGSAPVGSGDTNVVVPEPGSLSLLGTGLIIMGGLIRRKIKA